MDPSNAEAGPRHVAIIMDGNRRWAKARGLPTLAGHWQGADALVEVVAKAPDYGVRILTVFGFSTENWHRSQEEIDALFHVLHQFLISQRVRMVKEGVCLRSIGDTSRLPPELQAVLRETEEITSKGKRIDLVLALSYGGRDEMVRAIKRIRDSNIATQDIDEQLVTDFLDTRSWPDPDLVIRTSGEMRISNFILWQMAYAELYFTQTLWPDYQPSHLEEAIGEYLGRKRRKGV